MKFRGVCDGCDGTLRYKRLDIFFHLDVDSGGCGIHSSDRLPYEKMMPIPPKRSP